MTVFCAGAPLHILDIGSWADTAFVQYGAGMNCPVAAFVWVTLRPAERGVGRGEEVVSEGEQSSRHFREAVRGLWRVAARYFEVENYAATVRYEWPPEYGMGALAATAVAITAAAAAAGGQFRTPHQVATTAHRIADEVMGHCCGMHGHFSAALGGIGLYRFDPYPRTFIHPLTLPVTAITALEEQFMLVALANSPPLDPYNQLQAKFEAGQRLAREAIMRLRLLPACAMEAFSRQDLPALGEIMQEQMRWQQRIVPAVMTPETQHLRAIARRCSAWGWMVNGWGGSATIICAPGQRAVLEDAVQRAGFTTLPVQFDHCGVRVWSQAASAWGKLVSMR